MNLKIYTKTLSHLLRSSNIKIQAALLLTLCLFFVNSQVHAQNHVEFLDLDGYAATQHTPTQIASPIKSVNVNLDVQIAPNPASERVFIKVNEGVKLKAIEIIDMQGFVHFRGNLHSAELKLPSLFAGIYTFRIHTNYGVQHKRVHIVMR